VNHKVHLKIHQMYGKQFLSCCDSELLGKTFTEGKCCLQVTDSFYKGTEIPVEEACEIIAENLNTMDSIQIIGEHIIDYLHECDVISKYGARRVSGIPHVMFMRM